MQQIINKDKQQLLILNKAIYKDGLISREFYEQAVKKILKTYKDDLGSKN